MAKTIFMRRTLGNRLEPVDDIGREIVSKIGPGGCAVEIRLPRNLAHHRKYWALVNLIYQNQSRYRSNDELSDAIKVMIGHAQTVTMKNGATFQIPKSIAFHKMDQADFDDFYNRVIKLVCEEIIPGMDEGALRGELLEFAA